MKTDDLIDRLAQDADAVPPLPHVGMQVLRWILAAVFCLATSLTLFGVRSDLFEVLTTGRFMVQAVLGLTASVAAAVAALSLSIPAEERSPLARKIPVIVLVAWAGLLLFDAMFASSLRATFSMACGRDVLALGVLPGLYLFWLLRRGYALCPFQTALYFGIAAAALGAVGTQFLCRNDTPLHLLLWHFLPMLALALLAMPLGHWMRRRDRLPPPKSN